ncbi:MAG TPA: DUF3857 and transglutaminase domain-containing protein [Puia sp.]|nr:DUF3857 and transglutaminase domain-containing protein [Puia sp.]
MRIWMLFFFITSFSVLRAQSYNAQLIPDSLKTNAHAVKRYDEIILEIKSPAKAIEHEHHVYTILDEEGDVHAKYLSGYDKFISINSISGTLYDASGKEVKHIKKKDMQDISAGDEESLMTDIRYKVYDFYNHSYPYTVDFEEEDEVNGILEISDWFPQDNFNLSVQYSKYVIIAPKDYQVRYKPFNCSIQPAVTENGNNKIYTWEIRNLPAITNEPIAPALRYIVPGVLMAPSDFEAEGYKGNMSTWEGYGRFIYDLLKGRDVLPEDVKKKVHELTDNLTDPKEKISALYNYLQKNTRYISIQLGIGGLQPYDANYVATKRYGDCKALSNFMVALLKEAGIKGNSVVIKSGNFSSTVDPDFSCDQFDHVICCVPLQKDTVWLECTSQSLPAGYLSGFTSDRYGLLIDESGGKLVHTPKYGLKDNIQTRKISATINNEGNLTAAIYTKYKAMQQDELEETLNYLSKDKLMEWLKKDIDLPTYDVNKFDYAQEKNILPPVIDESLELTVSNYAQVSGKRLFISPNIMTRANHRLKTDEERKYPVELHYEYRDVDSVEINIPAGYQPEAIPQDIKLDNKFGKYICSIKVGPDKIIYYRFREQYGGTFPATDYSELVKYYEQLYKADHSKVVLVKKE